MNTTVPGETTPQTEFTTPQEHHKMRADALSCRPASKYGVRSCAACTVKFEPSRKWQHFCSEKCRKVGWAIMRRLEVPSDIRATLNRIESKLDQIIKGGHHD